MPKGPEQALPREFNYQVISRQGQPMHDGLPTPGAFDGMGAFPGPIGRTILIRNQETANALAKCRSFHPCPMNRRCGAFRTRALTTEYPYMWVDAT